MTRTHSITVKSFLRLIRWPNLLIIILTQCLVMFALIGPIYAQSGIEPALDILPFAALVFTTVIIAAAGYIINDYFDVRADLINKPEAVVVGKFLKRRKAIQLHMIVNSIAMLLGFFISLKVGSFRLGLIFPLMIVLLWFYSERYKRTILVGNLAVAFMSAMVVMIVWLFEFYALKMQPDKFMTVYTSLGLLSRIVFAFTLFAFLLTLVREIVKDAEDIEGDKETGSHTIAVVYGIKYSKIIAIILLVLTLLLVLMGSWQLYGFTMMIPSLYYLLMVALPGIYVILRLSASRSREDFHRISTLVKLIMLSGILGMAILAIYL